MEQSPRQGWWGPAGVGGRGRVAGKSQTKVSHGPSLGKVSLVIHTSHVGH